MMRWPELVWTQARASIVHCTSTDLVGWLKLGQAWVGATLGRQLEQVWARGPGLTVQP